jgi:hypothetical protein
LDARPACPNAKVSLGDALADVIALGWRDLRNKYLPKPARPAIPSAGSDPSESGVKDGTEGQVDIDGEDVNLATMDKVPSGQVPNTVEEELREHDGDDPHDLEYDPDYEVDIDGALEDLRSAHASKAPAPKLNRSTVAAILRQVDREGVKEAEPSEGLVMAAQNVTEVRAWFTVRGCHVALHGIHGADQGPRWPEVTNLSWPTSVRTRAVGRKPGSGPPDGLEGNG